MKAKFYNNIIENDYISEKELLNIFKLQYNDIFHNILKYEQNQIMILLQEQVYLHLRIIKKIAEFSLIQKTLSQFLEKYLDDKEKVLNTYQIIKNFPNQIIYLDYLNCFIHCTKCKNALHKCGHNFVVYNDYVFCLSCQEVYNEFQVHMYCKECNEEYFTKLREIKNEEQASIFQVGYEKYHCPSLDFEEQVKCTQCKNDLYADINSDKNKNTINEIFCQNCKYIYDTNKMTFVCFNCNCSFKSNIKIYNYFPPIKIDLLCAIHSLNTNKYALPFILANKYCKCDLAKIEMLKHNDGGDLLEGDKLDKKVIVCNKCYGVFNMDSFDWACPVCKKGFGIKKVNIYEYRTKDYNIKNKNIIKNQLNSSKIFLHIEDKKFKTYNNKQINKQNIYFSNNSSDKKINKKSYYYNTEHSMRKYKTNFKENYNNDFNIKNNEKIHKPSKSISYSLKNNNILRDGRKDNFSEKMKDNNYYTKQNSYKIINKEQIGQNYIYNNNKTKNSLIHSSEKLSNSHIYQKSGIDILRISFEDKTNHRNNLFHKNYNRNELIKKNLFYEKELNDIKMVRNYSERNNFFLKNKIENNIIYNTRNMLIKDNEKKINQTTENYSKNYNNSKNNYTQKTKSDKKLNHIKKINIINISKKIINNEDKLKKVKLNNNKTINNKRKADNNLNKIVNINKHFLKDNNDKKNININIKINNSNNSIIKINNNYIKNDYNIKKINSKSINKDLKKIDNYNINNNNNKNNSNSIRKNCIHIITNLNKCFKSNINTNRRKNHVHVISNINNNINKVNLNKNQRKNNIHIITSINNSNNNLNQSQFSQHKSRKITQENDSQIEKFEKNFINKNIKKSPFHSDKYNIVKSIGEGTFGKIYLVKKSKTNEIYALKQISLKDKEDLESKKKEFEFLMKLSEENPDLNIIKILGIEIKRLDKFNVVLYILMEAGKCDWEKEIYQRNKEKRYYKEEELINILVSLVDTFSKLQEKGISHRDVKPQNIVYFEGNKNKNLYKITDFGEAKINKNKKYKYNDMSFEKNTTKQTLRGTELYMSPLLFNALRNTGEIDIQYNPYKSDVFSLGLCILLAASLSYIPLYEIRQTKKMERMKSIIDGYLIKRYSKEFIKLLLLMLQINEKFRPDFIQLKSWISDNYL